jgi:hypothetical protein
MSAQVVHHAEVLALNGRQLPTQHRDLGRVPTDDTD